MKFFKKNLNKILLLVIYVVVFYGLSELLGNVLKEYATDMNKSIILSIVMNASLYLILIVSSIILLKREVVTDFKKLNRTPALEVFLICLVGIICAYLCNLIGSLITMLFGGGGQSQNQEGIELILLSDYGFTMIFVLVVVGPIVEELVFRKSIHDILRSVKCPTWIILIVSSVLFGFIHVIDEGDIIEVFPYIFMGFALGGIEIYSKNVYPSIIVHMLINGISTATLLYTYMLEHYGVVLGA